MNPCKVNDRRVGLSLRFFISNQNLCTFIHDMVAHPAHAFERSKLLYPVLQTGSLPQLWFTHAMDDNQQLAVHMPSTTSTSYISCLETAPFLMYLYGLWQALLIFVDPVIQSLYIPCWQDFSSFCLFPSSHLPIYLLTS